MRHKYFSFSALGTAALLSAALMTAGAMPAWADEAGAAKKGTEQTEASSEEEAESVEIIEEDAVEAVESEEFDEAGAVPASDGDMESEAGEVPADTADAAGDIMPADMSELDFITQYLEANIDNDLTNLLIEMPDEDIDMYIENAEGFSKTAPEAWKVVKEELGERTSDEIHVTVVQEDKNFIATQNVQFEKTDADFIYTFDQTLNPTDLVINVNYPMSVTLQRAGLNTLMGIGTVFLMLIFLCLVISLFKYIPNGTKKKQAKDDSPAPAPVRVSEPEPVYEEADDQELVAVIAAAIAAAEGTSPDGFVVRSIRRAGRRGRY